MRKTILPTILLMLFLVFPPEASPHPHILDIGNRTEISPEDLLDDLRQAQVIFIGEYHDHIGHHEAQLAIIDALDDDPTPLAIGLEMFRSESQPALDRWINNDMPLYKFIASYNDNWSMWPLYERIFIHAHLKRIKLIGLNIPKRITAKVSQNGFQSLPEEDIQLLGDVQCQVNQQYGAFIRRAMGGYGGHGKTFLYFCEAQLLWDTMMARNLLAFLRTNTDYRVIVLAGSGHAWKYGIPRQMLKEADITYRVILPEIFDRADRMNITKDVADYLWLDVDADGWKLE